MAVIINLFEVVCEPPPQQQAGTTQPALVPGSSQAACAPTPRDIERVVRRHIERLARVRAH